MTADATATRAPLTITANRFWTRATARFDTRDQAAAYVALFPKSTKLTSAEVVTAPGERNYFLVETSVRTAADGVNGGTNETGLRRIATIRRVAAKLGIEVIENDQT